MINAITAAGAAVVFALLGLVIFYYSWDPTAVAVTDLAPANDVERVRSHQAREERLLRGSSFGYAIATHDRAVLRDLGSPRQALALFTQALGGGIAWWAHIGGFVAGWALAPPLRLSPRAYRPFGADEGTLGFTPSGRR